MIVIAGWKDDRFNEKRNRFGSMEEAGMFYPEVLGGVTEVEEAVRIVREVNGEGNYHEFVLIVVDGTEVRIA